MEAALPPHQPTGAPSSSPTMAFSRASLAPPAQQTLMVTLDHVDRLSFVVVAQALWCSASIPPETTNHICTCRDILPPNIKLTFLFYHLRELKKNKTSTFLLFG